MSDPKHHPNFPGKQHVLPRPAGEPPKPVPPYPPTSPCLLPDDDTAVERLASALRKALKARYAQWEAPLPSQDAERIIAALREGGQR